MKKYRILLFLLVLLFVYSLKSEAQNSRWKTYRAYQYATMVEASSNYVFAIYNGALKIDNTLEEDGSLLIYSPADDEVKTFSLEDGLHDSNIVSINYHSGLKCLVIAYQNANIDLFYNQNDVTNIVDLKDKEGIQNKVIRNIDFIDNFAYVSGTFGALMIDLSKREVKGDFTKWGIEARSFCSWNGYLYVSTPDGLLKADPKSNLQDRTSWEAFPLDFEKQENIEQMLLFNNQLVFTTTDREVWTIDSNLSVRKVDSNTDKIRLLNNQLVLVQNNKISFYTDFTQKTVIPLSVKDISSNKEGTYWLANRESGLTEITKSRNSNEYTVTTSELKVNSPLRNYTSYLNFKDNKLLITGGERWGDRYHRTGTFMVCENGKWSNLDDRKMTDAIRAQLGSNLVSCKDLIAAVVDPKFPERYFVSSYGDGVYELNKKDSEFELVKLHTYNNSALQSAVPGDVEPGRYVRVGELVFDKNNNLFMTNIGVTNGIVMLKNDNTWKAFYGAQVSMTYLDKLIITKNNLKWGNIFRTSALTGIYVFNDNNTIDNTQDDEFYFSKSFTDQIGRAFTASEYSCLAEDLNGTVWVGTDNGPISFSSASSFRNNMCNRMIGEDQYGDGYYVMDGLKVTTIAVDGGNRKWMGTDGNGLYMVDQSGGELVVENYNTKNSLILSDKITSVAIDQKTGEIFIGTDKGLCSYRGDAIEGKSDYSNVYAFPNPVYPLRKNEVTVTGLMENSTIKITDVAGNLIKEANSIGGQYVWDCTDVNKEIVKAGIYLVFAIASDGSEGAVTKIMVIQ
ncbi:MAG: hypothetical protein LIO93_09545 [Bacteroidales bacterium]|nr:hypothetical protein [Bacteroidales bacterium]